MYWNAKEGEKVTMIHLFAIKYAKQIKQNNFSAKAIIQNAILPDGSVFKNSYATEIQKALNLAKYVEVKESDTE
ncbi:hypothetical protein FUT84_06765 [Treponema phagedenis]|nr:hypothetical protein FUT84_06765 [Treponema phagedenis]QEK07833.1 hypothetical protein FUT80_03670 [Treponema phagedenis]